MTTEKKSGALVAIIAMMFLYAMISFVTNLAAPIGTIWQNQPEIGGSATLGMMGNMMNFAAYLFMGIPAGMLLTKIGYKKTALVAVAVGFFGVLIQYLSGFPTGMAGFYVYLLGAFVSGFSVCMLNTVVNPMLNLIGGGGNKGNQLNMIGGTFNSLAGTLTPMFVGALIGQVTKDTVITQVNPALYLALGVFAAVFVILLFTPISDPEVGKVTSETKFEHSAWSFRHFVLGVVAIFIYVGVEVGIPATLIYYISDVDTVFPDSHWLIANIDVIPANAAAIAGFVAGTYWLLMLIGRIIGGAIAGKVSSKTMLTFVSAVGVALVLFGMFFSPDANVNMPIFTGTGFSTAEVDLNAFVLVLVGLCTSVMWSCIFNLATEGLGKYTSKASGIFMMMVVGGGVLPLIQSFLIGKVGYLMSYIVPLIGLIYILFYALVGCKNVNKDIPVD